MPRSQSSAVFASVCLASWLVASCDDSQVLVQLRTLSTEDPYQNLEEMRAVVRKDGEVVTRASRRFDGEPFALETIEKEDGLQIDITGLAADTLVARGRTFPKLEDSGGSCCVLLCFCLASTFDAGLCDCGDQSCRDECAP
jgi:hypothetical protein